MKYRVPLLPDNPDIPTREIIRRVVEAACAMRDATGDDDPGEALELLDEAVDVYRARLLVLGTPKK